MTSSNKDSIALLRRLRAGDDDDAQFVHRIDVCAAPPEVLVADLEPMPGTGLNDDGYSRTWYFYHAKKYRNSRGDTSGHRQRAVAGGGGTGWHSEISRKDVQGSGCGTFCNFSYGRKMGKSIDRMGWCMVEYDMVAADKKQDLAADDSSNYVLCKVYRSPRAKGKSESASSSSKKQTAKKRKAAGGDHPEAPPAKLIQQQEPQVQVQQHTPAYYPMPFYQPENVPEVAVQQTTADFNFNIDDINFYVDESMLRDEPEPESEQWHGGDNFNIQDFNVDDEYTDILAEMLQDEPEPGLQQPTIAEPEHDGRFIQLPCGQVLAGEATVGDILGPETALKPQRGLESEHEHEHGDKGLNMEDSFTVEWLLRGEPQQPIVPPPRGRAGEFIQMPSVPVVPVVAEATVDDMLGFGPETMYGQLGGGMTTTANIPWSSYGPTSSLYTVCSSLVQGPADPLRFPYLTC